MEHSIIKMRQLLESDAQLRALLRAVQSSDAADARAWQRLLSAAQRRYMQVVLDIPRFLRGNIGRFRLLSITWQDLPQEKTRQYLLVVQPIGEPSRTDHVYLDEVAGRIRANKGSVSVSPDPNKPGNWPKAE